MKVELMPLWALLYNMANIHDKDLNMDFANKLFKLSNTGDFNIAIVLQQADNFLLVYSVEKDKSIKIKKDEFVSLINDETKTTYLVSDYPLIVNNPVTKVILFNALNLEVQLEEYICGKM